MKSMQQRVTPDPSPEIYREPLYAKYADIQAPSWLIPNELSNRVARCAFEHRLQRWLPVNKDARCLDLGCGAGDLLAALKALGYHDLLGVDRGPQQIALARKRGLRVVEADLVDYLRACDQTYDLICVFDVIEHFRKAEVLCLLPLIWERLQPGGRVILQTPNAVSPWAAHYRYGDLTHELIFSCECLESTLKMASFAEIEMQEVAPFVHGLKSAVRRTIWDVIWAGCAIWNLAETGSLCGGIYTRNMLVKAVKR